MLVKSDADHPCRTVRETLPTPGVATPRLADAAVTDDPAGATVVRIVDERGAVEVAGAVGQVAASGHNAIPAGARHLDGTSARALMHTRAAVQVIRGEVVAAGWGPARLLLAVGEAR